MIIIDKDILKEVHYQFNYGDISKEELTSAAWGERLTIMQIHKILEHYETLKRNVDNSKKFLNVRLKDGKE